MAGDTPMFSKLMLLFPFALFTSAWKFYYDTQHE